MQGLIYRAVAWGPDVGVGINGARYITLQGIAKADPFSDRTLVGNEVLCSRLGAMLGLPTPPGALFFDSDDKAHHVGLQFGELAALPAPVVPPVLVASLPAMAAGIIAFDYWVANEDRNDGNLAFSPGNIPLAVFDHDQALGGGFRDELLKLPGRSCDSIVDLGSHCLAAHAPPAAYFGPWLDRIAGFPEALVRGQCESLVAAGYWSQAEAGGVTEFLAARRHCLRAILERELPDLDWGML
jgi:hypothetical protein